MGFEKLKECLLLGRQLGDFNFKIAPQIIQFRVIQTTLAAESIVELDAGGGQVRELIEP